MEGRVNYKRNRHPFSRGATSRVFHGESAEGSKVVIKKFKHPHLAEHEAAILQRIPRHQHVISLIDILENNIILEAHPGGKLGHFKKGKVWEEDKAIQITINILEGLKTIHESGILHCDITPHNLLIADDNPATVKIIDFGSAVLKDMTGEYRGEHPGATKWYRPPELKKENGVFWADLNNSSDLYSAGCICLYLLIGQAPFNKSHSLRIIENERLQELLRKAVHPNKQKRYQQAQEFIDVLLPLRRGEG
jgi:serine/threonine protein kinase